MKAGILLKILAGIFILFMLLAVTVANRGDGGHWWSFLQHIPHGDKLGHVGLMGTLSLLCNLALAPRRFHFLPVPVTRVTFVLFAIVTLEEISQAFIATRTCDLFDWLADLAGLAAGQLFAGALRNVFSKHVPTNL